VRAIQIGLVEAIAASTGEDNQLATMLDSVFEALTKTGHARVLMWLALEGEGLDAAEARLDHVIEATHQLRKKRLRAKGTRRTPPIEDTAHAVVLAALSLIGSAVIGPAIFQNAGLGGDDAALARFRTWMAKLLRQHLERAE